MFKAKGIPVPVPTICYWLHHGHLGLSPKVVLYPRQSKASKRTASPKFKPAGKSIDKRSEVINQRLRVGDYEIDTVLQTRTKNP